MYITVVVPALNCCPEVCVFTSSVTLPDLSAAVGSIQDTKVAGFDLSAIEEVISDGGQFTMVGAFVSSSVINTYLKN